MRLLRRGHRAQILIHRLAPLACCVGVLLGARVTTAMAQGVTGSTLEVRAHPATGAAAAPFTARVTDERTGIALERSAQAALVVRFGNLTPGGPYRVEVRAIGFHPVTITGIRLSLGQTLPLEVTLTPAAVELPDVLVTAPAPSDAGPGRTGPAFTVTDTAVRRLPLLNRDFVDLIQTAPEVSGTAIGGTNNRYNNILIDGGSDNDFFGLSRGTGAPGGQLGVRSLPLEAVREFQVLVAPYDVRQGQFLGGEVNAVTQSGTNRYRASAYTYYQGQGLTGKDSTGVRAANFSSWQFGGSASGPIIRNKLHFFVAGELRRRNAPFTGATIRPGSNVGISVDSVNRFVSILNGYGLDAGSYGGFTTRNSSGNLFAKLSASLGPRGLVEGSVNYAHGEIQDTIAPARAIGGDYRLTSAAFAPASTQWSTRLRWTTLFGGRIANEFLAGYLHTDEPRTPKTGYPAVLVSGVGDSGFAGARLIAGADPSSQRLALTQRSVEFTDNATIDLGRHTVTVGGRAEFLHFDFSSFASAIGQYQFTNLATFAAGTPSRFQRGIELRPGASAAQFSTTSVAFYVQDRWEPIDRLAITAGFRVDVPLFPDHPTTNAALLASPFAVNTGKFIKTTPLLGPRLGITYTMDDRTNLRGGVGLFSGRPPYSWMSFAFTQTGNDVVLLNCSGAAAPAFVPDPRNQPTACVSGSTPATPVVSYFDKRFKMPQSLKLSLGVDRELPWGIVASLDGLYQRGYRQPYILDDNLTGPVGTLAGEGGRTLYGSVAAGSVKGAVAAATPGKVSTAFGPVLHTTYDNRDRTYLVTAQLRKRFSGWLEANAAYTYTDAKDLVSLRDAQTVSNYGFLALDGTLNNRRLGTSVFSTPHKLTISGSVNLPGGTSLSLTYIGRSGLPFTYVVNGDANADGVGSKAGAFDRQLNDPVYVPADAADFESVRDSVTTGTNTVLVADPAGFARLATFMGKESCLTAARGTLLHRNACRNPWQHVLNARVAKQLTLWNTHSVEFTFDVFNLLHLLNGSWGLIRETGSFASAGGETVPLLKLRGYDSALGRNLYEVTLPARNAINIDASRWRMQVGARYAF
jgi:hypothetical protein